MTERVALLCALFPKSRVFTKEEEAVLFFLILMLENQALEGRIRVRDSGNQSMRENLTQKDETLKELRRQISVMRQPLWDQVDQLLKDRFQSGDESLGVRIQSILLEQITDLKVQRQDLKEKIWLLSAQHNLASITVDDWQRKCGDVQKELCRLQARRERKYQSDFQRAKTWRIRCGMMRSFIRKLADTLLAR